MTTAEAFDHGVRTKRYKHPMPQEIKDLHNKKYRELTPEEKLLHSSFRRGIQFVLEEELGYE